ncbi:MAG: exodeoxyribonuclease VII large subunit [Gammaproteobacteria bacterium]|nr:exodeoxyribonuclease VII large subunit [Gammaproteobacteria bacterium]
MPEDGTNEPIHTVAQAIERVNRVLNEQFLPLWVTGEISNLYDRNHWYFDLVDGKATLHCIAWQSVNRRFRFKVENGSKVNIRGKFTIYPDRGQFQILVDRMELAGEGALRAEFERLRGDLEREGLFRPEHKKPIPKFPKRIALLTAESGAAIKDVIQNFSRRYPLAEIVHVPTLVQGRNAPDSITSAIRRAMRDDVNADVLLLTRGGGSYEDLNAFNDEVVARAIFACPIPVVSAIGHEKDVSISDFVADQRAATPSTAVELMAPDRSELRQQVIAIRQKILGVTSGFLSHRRQNLETVNARLRKPTQVIEYRTNDILRIQEKLLAAIETRIKPIEASITNLDLRLQRVSPNVRIENLDERLTSLNHRLQRSNPITHLNDLERRRSESQRRLGDHLNAVLTRHLNRVQLVFARLSRIQPLHRVEELNEVVIRMRNTLTSSIRNTVEILDASLRQNVATLRAVSPLATLERGYAVVTKPDGTTWGEIVSDIDAVNPNEPISAHVHGGTIDAVVQGTRVRDADD